MKAAYQGLPGAFGHQACLAALPGYEPAGEPGFAEVVAAVIEGRAERGILPVENNQAGPVEGVRELLGTAGLEVIGEHVLPVRLHLLGVEGASLEQVRIAVSHGMALRQCAGTLARLGLETEEAPNTAVAARQLRDPARAAVASEAAARAYGLVILMEDVHDRPDNATTFALIARAGS